MKQNLHNENLKNKIYAPALSTEEHGTLVALVILWGVGTLSFWRWAVQPEAWVSMPGTLINLLILFYITGYPAWPFYLFLRMRQVRNDIGIPAGLRVAMVVTKAPSEPWPLVQRTLLSMLAQDPKHDTWLADEQPTKEIQKWCEDNNVQVSSRAGVLEYHQPYWPRRSKCKEGNLAYFYDHFGYKNYDVVVQLDADHIPQEGYLIAMLQPFNNPEIGYVAAPSICNLNADRSWVARGRLFGESVLHGPMQLGLNHSYAPLCFGSHYAVRTKALEQVGGLGPELAEDHSTTLLLNAHGWRGAFAHRAICHGLGPETFEDAMVQEFQWSRSLTTILLSHSPEILPKLPVHLRLQFLVIQSFYPIQGALSALGLGLPILALLLDNPWMRVHYPTFLLFSILHSILTRLPLVHLRRCGLLRPYTAPPISWEHTLFELSRAPWVLVGVIRAVEQWLWPRSLTFQVTKKQINISPLPIRLIAPYLAAAVIGVVATLVFSNTTQMAKGYILLTLISATLFAITALAVTVLSHFQGEHSLRMHMPQAGLAGCAFLFTLGCFIWRLSDLAIPLQMSSHLPLSTH